MMREFLARLVLQRSQRRENKRPSVEPVPWKVDGQPLRSVDKRAGIVEIGRRRVDRKLQRARQLSDLRELGESLAGMPANTESPRHAIFIDCVKDGPGHAREHADGNLIAQPGPPALAARPAEVKRREAIVVNHGRNQRERNERQTETLRNVVGHIRFIDQQSVKVGVANRFEPVAKHHASGIAHPFHGEAENLSARHLSQLLVQFLKSSQGVIALADQAEINSRRSHARLDIGDSEDDDGVSALLEATRQRGEWVQVPRSRKTECAQPCHVFLC